MGIMDKVSAGIKNVDNKIGADIDESKYNSKIRELQKEIEEMKSKLGDRIYQAFLKERPSTLRNVVEISRRSTRR